MALFRLKNSGPGFPNARRSIAGNFWLFTMAEMFGHGCSDLPELISRARRLGFRAPAAAPSGRRLAAAWFFYRERTLGGGRDCAGGHGFIDQSRMSVALFDV